ncbi:hypothetical protein KKF38_02440 [Patescibacteria group bacterium]|nr:hypothetical protein [Patescibacteria group bacterium]
MFKNFRHRAQNFIDRMANNPAEASRAVFASLLIIGICSLSLDLGQRITPESFEARLLNPLDRATLETAQDLDDANNDPEEKLKLIDACKTARADNDYGTFLDNFENSFAGILPGAGNLLLEHPSTVSDRREKLIFEVMKNYAELKFCIPSDQFKVIYLADYRNVFGELNFFFQVFLYEEDSSEYPIDEISDVFIDTAMREYILVEKDLISTQKYVTEVIDRAIESAIELDQQTQNKLASIVNKTTNKLIITTNSAIKRNSDILNQANTISASISGMTSDLRELLALEESIQGYVNYGGAWKVPEKERTVTKMTGMAAGNKSVQSSIISTDQAGLDDLGKIVEEAEDLKLSFGLLNLLNGIEQAEQLFHFERLGAETAMYLGALHQVDPFTPGYEEYFNFVGSTINTIAINDDQMCYSVTDSTRTCFGYQSIQTNL